MRLLYTKDEGEGEILALRRGRHSQIFSIEMAGTDSQLASSLALRAVESEDIIAAEAANISSFYVSGDISMSHEGSALSSALEEEKERAILSKNGDTIRGDCR
jgi:hypothetical protein